jgi:tape measure domain-containing protein
VAKTDLETLVVRMEAQMKTFENEMKRGRQVADRETRAIERRFADTNKKLANSFAGLGAGLTRGFGAIGIGLGANELAKFADSFTNIQNALKVTGLEGDKLNSVYEKLFASAQRNAVPIGSLAALYGRLALVSGELGVLQEQLITFTDKIALAIRVSGTSAEQASGALTQLSQALGGGVVRAEEFNSMMEGAPTIVQAVARGIEEAGGSVAKLRTLVTEGKVSSKAFFDAYLIGSADLEKAAGKMDSTIAQAITRVGNAFTDAIGKINKSGGASDDVIKALNSLGAEIKWIGDNIDSVAKPFKAMLGWLREIEKQAERSARWIGRVTGADKIGPAAKKQLGIDQVQPRTSIMAPDLDLTGGNGGASAPAKPISVNDPNYKPPAKPPKDKASTVGVDSFERAIASAEKRIAVERAETAAIDEGTAARERAKIVAELQAAAVAQNTAEGLKNTEVTAKQNIAIQETADKMYKVALAAERANEPLARASRSAMDMGTNLQNIAVSSIDQAAGSFYDIATGAKTAKEAVADLAQSVLRDLSQMIIKALLYRAVMAAFGGGGGIGAGPIPMVGAAGGMAVPTFMAGGGQVRGPGSGTSDSVPAWLSPGEFVVRASVARQNRALLEFMNARGYAAGGMVPTNEYGPEIVQ